MDAAEKQGLRYLAAAFGTLLVLSITLWLSSSLGARGASSLTSPTAAVNGTGVEYTAPQTNLFAPNPFDNNYQKHFTEHVHIRRKTGPSGEPYQYITKWYVLYGQKYWKPLVMEYDQLGRWVTTYWGRPVRTGVCPQCGLPCASVKWHPELWNVSRTETIYPRENIAVQEVGSSDGGAGGGLLNAPKYDTKSELDFMYAHSRKFWRVRYRDYSFYHQKWQHVRTSYSEVYLLPNGKGEDAKVNPVLYVNWDVEKPLASTGGWQFRDWPAQVANGGTLKVLSPKSVPDPEEVMREFVRYGKVGSPDTAGSTE